jgi:hypothetical protein
MPAAKRGAMLAFSLACAGATAAAAQTARVTGVGTLQFIQVRPLVADSVPVEETTGEGLIRRTADGHLVRCVTGERLCRFTRSGDSEAIAPFIQDVTLNAWGLGQGVRVQAQLRTRAAIGGHAALWPHADDAVDLLSAFVELDRPRYRLRGGRIWKTSGLGYYNFDGASALVRLGSALRLEAYGGWSLARGLNEPRTSESLSAIEAFAPDARSLLLGAQASYRPSPALGIGALYQREIRSDRLGLYAERVAADAAWSWNRGNVTGTLEADLATRHINDARLVANATVSTGLSARAFARYYRPFFELWTIWGAFDPVGFGELGAGGAWRPAGRPFELDFDLTRRSYDETSASTVFGNYRTNGWSASAAGSWRANERWLAQGVYRIEFGFGAARSESSLRVQRTLNADAYVAASTLAFQRQFEFRVAEGTVYGLGADGRIRLNPRTRLAGALSVYRHRGTRGEPGVDWSQFRGHVQLEWTLGSEPGRISAAGGAR